MKYKYDGVDSRAKKVSGEIEARNDADARAQLRAKKIRPNTLKLVKGGADGKTKSAGFSLSNILGQGSGKPSLIDMTTFIRQLATMQQAGVPIVTALGVLSEQVENRAFGAILGNVQRQIEEGVGLTEAMRKYPHVFDKIFLNLAAAGEVSGSLDKVLLRLATFYEKSAQLRRKIVSAATYPILIVVIVFVVVFVLLTFVVPTFAKMFSSGGRELPEATQAILALSDFFSSYWYLIIGSVVGLVMFARHAWGDTEMRKTIDPFMIKLPIFGDLIMKIGIARFSRTMSTMIQSGVPILEALDICANVAGNYTIESAVRNTKTSISEGNSISGPLARAQVFPKMAVSMIAIGEQTGSLESMLGKIAEFYEDEVDAKVGALSSVLEPLMIVIVGVVVAGVLIPMYLPIFKMADTLG